jgi:type I restriction-modification system DNA methylase subunit
MAKKKVSETKTTANIGFEAKLWLAADKLRNNMDAAEYKQVVAPYQGRIYDPACGSGGMFVQSEKFVESHGGKLGDISIYGQESNATTRRLAIMNLSIRGIEADIGKEHADLARIVSTYHAWRGDRGVGVKPAKKTDKQDAYPTYEDIAGFCKSATTAEIAAHGHVLTPGRYVGAEEVEDDGEPFEEKMPRLVAELQAQFAESAKLEKLIKKNLKGLGYEL